MAADRIKGITIEIGGNTTKLQKALEGTNKQLKTTQSQLKDVDKLLKLDPKNTELLAQKQRLLAEAVSGTEEKLQTLKEAQKQMNKLESFTPEQQREYDALQREIISTESDLKNLEKQTKANDKAMSAFTRAGDAFKSFGSKAEKAGKKLLPVTGAITGLGVAAGAAWTEVDAAQDKIKVMTGAAGEDFQGLIDIMNEVATTIPTSFDTAATAVGEINTRFGLTGAELEELSEKFIKFAELNGQDVKTAIDDVQEALAAYGEPVENAADVLDQLTLASQKSGVSAGSLLATVLANRTAFGEMGLSIEDAISFLAMMETSGASSDEVLTGLKKAMQNAAKEGQPLNEALGEVENAMLNAASKTEGMQAAIDTFGTKAGPAIYNAVSSGKISLSDFTGYLDGWEGTVDQTFEETADAPDKMTTAVNALKLAGSELIETVLEAVGPIIEDAVNAVIDAVKWFSSLDDTTKKIIVTVLGVLAVAGPLLSVIGKISSVIGVIVQHPILALIGAVILALVTLYQKCEPFRDFVNNLWNNILVPFGNFLSGTFMTAWNAIGTFFNNTLGPAVSAVTTLFSTLFKGDGSGLQFLADFISGVFTSAWQGLVDFYTTSGLEGIVTGIGDAFSGILTKMQPVATWISGTFTTAIEGIKTALSEIASFITNVFSGDWENAWNQISTMFSTVWEGFVEIAKTPINGIIDFLNSLLLKVQGVLNVIINGINDLFSFSIGPIEMPGPIPNIPEMSFDLLGLPPITWFEEHQIPHLAKGGILTDGSALVGESGPELLTMQGASAYVRPLPGSAGYDNSEVLAAMADILAGVDALAARMSGLQVVMDSGALVGSIATRMDNTLAMRSVYRQRRI